MTTISAEKSALDYARLACDIMIKKFDAEDLPPKGIFHYHQGVFLSGMQKCYRLCDDKNYDEYIKKWVDSIVHEDGSVHEYSDGDLDDLQPAILLFDLYRSRGEEKYKIVLDTFAQLLKNWKVNKEGGFWHKANCPDQMWLDGLYMAGPLAVEYGKEFGGESFYDMMVTQTMLMKKHTKNEKTGLYLHGWDCEKIQPWADPETGLASEHWGRAMGWYVVAILDMLEFMPLDYKHRQEMVDTVTELIVNLIKYQDEKTGMWYQVVDKVDLPGNWPEGSCSSLYVYGIAKAVRLGLLDASYMAYARKGYRGVIDAVKYDDQGGIIIDNVCIGTGISDYAYYISRPTSVNDLHGMGAFILMCDEYWHSQKGSL